MHSIRAATPINNENDHKWLDFFFFFFGSSAKLKTSNRNLFQVFRAGVFKFHYRKIVHSSLLLYSQWVFCAFSVTHGATLIDSKWFGLTIQVQAPSSKHFQTDLGGSYNWKYELVLGARRWRGGSILLVLATNACRHTGPHTDLTHTRSNQRVQP